MSKTKTSCGCGKSFNGICKNCSAYKMVFLLLPGWDHLKNISPSGELVNPVRYSYYRQNNKPPVKVMENMLRRFSNHILYTQASRKIQFYENHNAGDLILEVEF